MFINQTEAIRVWKGCTYHTYMYMCTCTCTCTCTHVHICVVCASFSNSYSFCLIDKQVCLLLLPSLSPSVSHCLPLSLSVSISLYLPSGCFFDMFFSSKSCFIRKCPGKGKSCLILMLKLYDNRVTIFFSVVSRS